MKEEQTRMVNVKSQDSMEAWVSRATLASSNNPQLHGSQPSPVTETSWPSGVSIGHWQINADLVFFLFKKKKKKKETDTQ